MRGPVPCACILVKMSRQNIELQQVSVMLEPSPMEKRDATVSEHLRASMGIYMDKHAAL